MILFSLFLRVYSECSTKLFYSECDSLNKRDLVITSSPDCPNPEPQLFDSLDCDFSCPAGTYLSTSAPSQQSCTKCPKGTYSIGGGLQFGKPGLPWSNLPPYSINSCSSRENSIEYLNFACNHWLTEENLLSSSTSSLNNSYTAYLTFFLQIVKKGNFTIKYSKTTVMNNNTKTGVFKIKKNYQRILQDDQIEDKNWKKFSVELEPGLNEVRVEYNSEKVQGSWPKAYISSIQVTGTEYAQSECFPCEFGSGDTDCEICEFNEYYQDGICQQCPEGTYSYKGSKSLNDCLEKPECTGKDYKKVYSDCVNSSRTESYAWKTPLFCDNSKLTLPQSQPVPCTKCQLGYLEKTENFTTICETCPNFYYLNTSTRACSRCPAGTSANKIWIVDEWTELPGTFETYCLTKEGLPCPHSLGWELNTEYLSTGTRHQSGTELVLAIRTNIIENSGKIIVDTEIINELNGTLDVFLNKKKWKSWNMVGRSSERIELGKGTSLVEIVYAVSGGEGEEIRIYNVGIDGSDKGASLGCSQCDLGFYKSDDSDVCLPCPAGTTSNKKNTECVQCSYFQYSSKEGSLCTYCPEMTHSSSNREFCLATTYMSFGQRIYNIHILSGNEYKGGNHSCGLPALKNYTASCLQTFYGPSFSNDKEFFVSVLNPSRLDVPLSEFKKEVLPSYAYAVEKYKNSSSIEDLVCLQQKQIISLGTKIANISHSPEGIVIWYFDGDLCDDSQKYSSSLTLICDQDLKIASPILSSTSKCNYNFMLKSKFACPVCNQNETKLITGACKNGEQKYKKIEGKNCIISLHQEIEWVESCSDYTYIFHSVAFILISILIFLLLLFSIILTCCYYKYKRSQYKLIGASNNKIDSPQ